MFNGLIRELARVKAFQNNILSLEAKHKANLGDSIAVNGACLTVIKTYENGFDLELSKESRTHLALENYKDLVHIEPALQFGARIDGHLLQGHIDAIGTLKKIQKNENGMDFFISLPSHILPFVSEKGSIAIDGISLTINELLGNDIRLTIIPITFRESLLHSYKIGRRINIESDLLARYVLRALECKNTKTKELSWQDIDKISFLY